MARFVDNREKKKHIAKLVLSVISNRLLNPHSIEAFCGRCELLTTNSYIAVVILF